MLDAVPLVHITRGPLVECVHRGHVAVVDHRGKRSSFAGSPDFVTYARSSAKLLQALPVISSGAAANYRLTEEEIALLCASHSGETGHVEGVSRMLAKIGLQADKLQCGAHAPFHRPSADAMRARGEEPTVLHNNCSGKHTGMLALASHLGASLDSYMDPGHPVQRTMLETFAAMAGCAPEDVLLGTDGCGVPVYGVPLWRIALAYARLGAPEGLPAGLAEACRAVVRAVAANPSAVAGSGRYDTALIRETGGRLIGKMGAEGVFAVSRPETSEGLAVKIEDGAQRALYPAVTEALYQLGWLNAGETERLKGFHHTAVRNWSGAEIGQTVPVLRLERV